MKLMYLDARTINSYKGLLFLLTNRKLLSQKSFINIYNEFLRYKSLKLNLVILMSYDING